MEQGKRKAEGKGETLNVVLDDSEQFTWETKVNVHSPRAEYGNCDLIVQPMSEVLSTLTRDNVL